MRPIVVCSWRRIVIEMRTVDDQSAASIHLFTAPDGSRRFPNSCRMDRRVRDGGDVFRRDAVVDDSCVVAAEVIDDCCLVENLRHLR